MKYLILLFIVSGCSHVTVKDKEVCADLGYVGAHCAHTYTDTKRDIPKYEWDAERIGWMCTPAESFSDTEDSIDELCRITNKCDYETREIIQKYKDHIRPLAEEARQMRLLIK